MNEKHLFLRGRTYGWLLAASVMLFGACTDAIEPETFNPGVSNITLAAPEITAMASADGKSTILSWPVLFGAGGFQMSLYKLDGETEIAIVTDTIIDGSKCEFPREDDTNYKLLVQTLGNEKYNNQGSEQIEFLFSSLVPKIHEQPISSTIDLAQWLTDNKTLIDSQTEEFAIELTGGETYTMNASYEFGTIPVTIRSSNKNNPATIVMGETSGFITQSGLKIKNLNFDCNNFTGKSKGFISYSASPTIDKTKNYYFIPSSTPVVLQNCKITGLKVNLFYDNNKQWCPHTEMIKGCIIEMDQSAMDSNSAHVFNHAKGFCYKISVTESSIYSTTKSKSSYLINLSNTRADRIGIEPTNLIEVKNNTFHTVCYNTYMVNGNGIKGRSSCNLEVEKCIFEDCSRDAVARGLMANGNDNMSWNIVSCCFWYGGKEGDTGRPRGTGHKNVDPMLELTTEGYWKTGSNELIEARFGDPRGLQ